MSTTVDTLDGGFSPETTNINFIAEPGVLNSVTDAVDRDTNTDFADEVIAMGVDHDTASGARSLLLIADDGEYATWNGSATSVVSAQVDSGNSYTFGFVDIISYQDGTYVTSDDSIELWESTATFNDDADYSFGGLTDDIWHPALVYEKNAYFGDGNRLLRITAAKGTPTAIITLPTEQLIVALGIDPGTGKMLISTSSGQNPNGTIPRVNKIQWYDGRSDKVSKVIEVEDIVCSFQSVGGIVYVGYGTSIGMLTGSGIQFLRQLVNATYTQVDLPYKHHMATIGRFLCFVDGTAVIGYGEIEKGRKVFFPIVVSGSSNKIQSIHDAGNNRLAFSYAAHEFRTIDMSDITPVISGGGNFFSLKYQLPRPAYVRGVRVFYKANIGTGSETIGTVSLIDDTNTTTVITTVTQDSANSQGHIISEDTAIKTTSIQIRYVNVPTTLTNIHGPTKLIIHYDWAE